MVSKTDASTYLGGNKTCTHTCSCFHTETRTHKRRAVPIDFALRAFRFISFLPRPAPHIVPAASSPRLSGAVDPIRRFSREVLARGRSSFDGSLSSEYQVPGLPRPNEARQGDQSEISGSLGTPVRKESDRPHTQF